MQRDGLVLETLNIGPEVSQKTVEIQEHEREKDQQPQIRDPLRGTIDKSGTVSIDDSGRFGELEDVGYGEREGKKVVLKGFFTDKKKK